MLSFPHRYSKSPNIPTGFQLETNQIPNAQSLNGLLSKCNLQTHPAKQLELALQKSDYCLSIFEEVSERLVGFVRVTSDKGLNANLWDLAAQPGQYQEQFLTVLINRVLRIIRRDMPGCSISIAAPSIAINALKGEDFILDPGGIRTMGFQIR